MYKIPSITVDIFIQDFKHSNSFVLISRKNEPFKNHWALPGGFIDYGESAEDAAIREAKEETNIDINQLELFNVYSKGDRDPRGHTITIVYLAFGDLNQIKAGSDAKEYKISNFDELKSIDLAFDHKNIINDIYNHNFK
jgi:8-oxo-dGTP diphosphatase